MPKKENGGKTIKNLIKTFEGFKKVVSKEINIKIGEKDGEPTYNTYQVHAVSPRRLAEIRGNFKNAKPVLPAASLDGDGKPRKIETGKTKQYNLDVEKWKQTEVCYLVLAGWIEPEEIPVEGKTDIEKVEYIFNNAGVVGHLNIIATAVEEVSALSGEDINFI